MADILKTLSRRSFLLSAGAAGFVASSGLATPFYARGYGRPEFIHGVQSGDVDTSSGMIWTRVDRPSKVSVEYSTTESFSNPLRLSDLTATPQTDCAIKCSLDGLLPDQDIFYRFTATDLYDVNRVSAPVTGRFRTAPCASARSASSGPATRPGRAGALMMSA